MQANRGSAHGPRPRSSPTESAAKGGALAAKAAASGSAATACSTRPEVLHPRLKRVESGSQVQQPLMLGCLLLVSRYPSGMLLAAIVGEVRGNASGSLRRQGCWVRAGRILSRRGVACGGQRHCAREWSLYTKIYSVMYGVVRLFAPTQVLASRLSKRALCKAQHQLFRAARSRMPKGVTALREAFARNLLSQCPRTGAHPRGSVVPRSVAVPTQNLSWLILALTSRLPVCRPVCHTSRGKQRD
jgi:hypothetical protein